MGPLNITAGKPTGNLPVLVSEIGSEGRNGPLKNMPPGSISQSQSKNTVADGIKSHRDQERVT